MSGFYQYNDPDTIQESHVSVDLEPILEPHKGPNNTCFPLQWDEKIGKRLANFISQSYDLESVTYPPWAPIEWSHEFMRFKELLLFYDYKFPIKYMTTKEILTRTFSEGPSFNIEVGDLLKGSIRATFDLNEESLALQTYPKLFGSINYIMDPQSLFRWSLPDEKDWEYMLGDPKVIPEDLIQHLIEEFDIIMSNVQDVPVPTILDKLKFFKKSKVLVEPLKGLTKTNYLVHDKLRNFNLTNQFTFKRCLIWKNPIENRDALIGTPETMHTISDVSSILKFICQDLPEYKLKKFDPYKELSKLNWNHKLIYMMSDTKKCGLTFPRQVVVALLKRLQQYYPDCESLRLAAEAYSKSFTLFLEDNSYHLIKNGIGLGMLAELVTLVHILIFRYAVKQDLLPKNCKGWFLNDDQLLFWEPDDNLSWGQYLSNWNNLLTSFGLTVHSEKPFISKSGQFCEQWTIPFNEESFNMEKVLRQYNILLKTIDSYNIVDAKERYSNQYKYWWGLTDEDYRRSLHFVTSFWGFEFHPEEIFLPFEFGGWIREKANYLNIGLKLLFGDKIPKRYKRVWTLYKEPKLNYRVWDNTYSIIRNLQDSFIEDNHELSLYTKVKQISKSVNMKFTMQNSKSYDTYHKKLYDLKLLERLRCFNSSKPIDLDKFINNNEFNNYAIPVALIKGEHKPPFVRIDKFFVSETGFEDPFIVYNLINGTTPLYYNEKKGYLSILNLLGWGIDNFLIQSDPYLYYNFILNQAKFARFGKNSKALVTQALEDSGMDSIELLTKPIPFKQFLKDCFIGSKDGDIIIPIDNLLWSIHKEDFIEILNSKLEDYDLNISRAIQLKSIEYSLGFPPPKDVLDDLYDNVILNSKLYITRFLTRYNETYKKNFFVSYDPIPDPIEAGEVIPDWNFDMNFYLEQMVKQNFDDHPEVNLFLEEEANYDLENLSDGFLDFDDIT